jgi:hypothetical protein
MFFPIFFGSPPARAHACAAVFFSYKLWEVSISKELAEPVIFWSGTFSLTPDERRVAILSKKMESWYWPRILHFAFFAAENETWAGLPDFYLIKFTKMGIM